MEENEKLVKTDDSQEEVRAFRMKIIDVINDHNHLSMLSMLDVFLYLLCDGAVFARNEKQTVLNNVSECYDQVLEDHRKAMDS
jgi:hypothetical protein